MRLEFQNQWRDRSDGFVWLGLAVWTQEIYGASINRRFIIGGGILGMSVQLDFEYLPKS